MFVLGIGGSPCVGGNTDQLLDSALSGAKSSGATIEKLILNQLNIRPCQECGGCDITGRCIIQDDMQKVYPKLRTADRVIVASPIFFNSISAQLKIIIDRCQAVWVEKYILKQPVSKTSGERKGIFIATKSKKGMAIFECATKVITAFFATQNIQFCGSLFYDGIDEHHPITQHPTVLSEANSIGAKLVEK